MMKKYGKKIVMLVLAVIMASSVLALSACNKNDIVQKGIVYDDKVEKITKTGINNALKEIIWGVYKGIFNYKGSEAEKDLPQTVIDYYAVADQADVLLHNSGITEEQYEDLCMDLFNNKKYYIDFCVEYWGDGTKITSSEGDETGKSLLSLALKFCSVLGKEKFSDFVFDLYSFRLNYIYDSCCEKYKEATPSNVDYLRLEMDNAEQDMKTFKKIDKEDFEKLLCGTLLIFDMFIVDTSSTDFSLSDSETAKLLQIPDFNVNIDQSEWKFLLKKFGTLIPGYYSYMFLVADNNKNIGDNEFGIPTLALKMEYVVKLISSFQNYMDASAVEKLRKGEKVKFALEIINKASDQDWIWFERILYYDKPKFDYYGDQATKLTENNKGEPKNLKEGSITFTEYNKKVMSYDKYLENISSKSKLSEKEKEALKQQVIDKEILLTYDCEQAKEALLNATEDTLEYVVEGIIAGISPALSYGWHNKIKFNVDTSES